MRVEALSIERGSTYSNAPDQLKGSITLKDTNGATLEIPLTPAAISRLIASIAKEAADTLTYVAQQAPRALQQAQDEGLLIEQDGKLD